MSKGFGQTALGHETYELVRTHFTQEAKPYLHGEIVAIGDCLQLAFNGHPEQVAPFRAFMRSMNMPLTLRTSASTRTPPRWRTCSRICSTAPSWSPPQKMRHACARPCTICLQTDPRSIP